MTDFPKSFKQTVSYGNLTWDVIEGAYTYDEVIKHFCKQETLEEYELFQKNVKIAETAHDSAIIIATADEEINWVTAGKATKI